MTEPLAEIDRAMSRLAAARVRARVMAPGYDPAREAEYRAAAWALQVLVDGEVAARFLASPASPPVEGASS